MELKRRHSLVLRGELIAERRSGGGSKQPRERIVAAQPPGRGVTQQMLDVVPIHVASVGGHLTFFGAVGAVLVTG
jgi:hypothetical protein